MSSGTITPLLAQCLLINMTSGAHLSITQRCSRPLAKCLSCSALTSLLHLSAFPVSPLAGKLSFAVPTAGGGGWGCGVRDYDRMKGLKNKAGLIRTRQKRWPHKASVRSVLACSFR